MGVSDRDLRIIQECSTTNEPIIVLRGQDGLAVPALFAYRAQAAEHGVDAAFAAALEERMQEFINYGEVHQLKIPDLREGENHHSPTVERNLGDI